MKVKKAGCVLINLESKKIGLVYNNKKDDYSFPKGHLEKGETLTECAIRETEEETGRMCHIILDKELDIISYLTPKGEDVENHLYLAVDDGESKKVIPDELKEQLVWKSLGDVENTLTYQDLKDVWNNSKYLVAEVIKDIIIPAELTDMGICPTCFDKDHNNCLYGDNTDKILYESEEIECFLAGNPRSEGHVIISTKKHYKDMMELTDELCRCVFTFAKKVMNVIKDVYECESVYLCTMCDGPMNHFHVQLIPRYKDEKRGSRNFVKERKAYVHNEKKLKKIRDLLSK